MSNLPDLISSHPFATLGLIAGGIALFGLVQDHRHTRRADLDRVSLIAWGKISTMAMIVAIVALATVLHGAA